MRRLTSFARLLGRRASVVLAAAQGLAGVACVTAGAYLLWGTGWALLAAGGFLLLGAWGRS